MQAFLQDSFEIVIVTLFFQKVPQFFFAFLSVALLLLFVQFSRCKHAPGASPDGGDKRVRTADPLLAKQVLSQLSYTPENGGP